MSTNIVSLVKHAAMLCGFHNSYAYYVSYDRIIIRSNAQVNSRTQRQSIFPIPMDDMCSLFPMPIMTSQSFQPPVSNVVSITDNIPLYNFIMHWKDLYKSVTDIDYIVMKLKGARVVDINVVVNTSLYAIVLSHDVLYSTSEVIYKWNI